MVGFDELALEITSQALQCPEMVIERALRNAAIEFIGESELWRESVSFTTVAGQAEYDLTLQHPNTSLVKVVHCTFDGKELLQTVPQSTFVKHGLPTRFFVRDNRIVLKPEGQILAGLTVHVEIVLRPSRTATRIPRFIADNWFEGIQHGALSRILSMTGYPWYDMRRAAMHDQQAAFHLERAKREGTRSNHSRILTTRFSW